MKYRFLFFGLCLTMAACSAGTTKTVTGAGSPTTTFRINLAPPTLPPNAATQLWTRDTGIDNNPPQMSIAEYCENSYSDPYRSGWVFMCAGGVKDPSTLAFVKGAIWVKINPDPRQSGPMTKEPPDSPTYEYDAPNATSVKILSVTGDIVNLQREDGSTLTFNLQTKQFS